MPPEDPEVGPRPGAPPSPGPSPRPQASRWNSLRKLQDSLLRRSSVNTSETGSLPPLLPGQLTPQVSGAGNEVGLSPHAPKQLMSRLGLSQITLGRNGSSMAGSSLMGSSLNTGGLIGPGGLAATAGAAEMIVSAVKSLRKASMMLIQPTNTGSPGLGTKAGSLATYFYAPHPTPGKGIALSPTGRFLARFGYGPDVKILRMSTGEVAATVSLTVAHVRFATFSQCGQFLVAATDDCRLLIWDVEQAVSGAHKLKALVANVDVGLEPLAYCVLSPDATHVLSCDDDGQLELWSVAQAVMVRRYDVNFPAKRASFNKDGSAVIACADFDIQVSVIDTHTGEVLATEVFEALEEARNKTSYAISLDGSKVLVFVTEQCFVYNLAVYDIHTHSYHKLLVCGGTIVHAEFSADGADFVVSGRDDLLHVFDTATALPVVSLDGHASDVMFARVSADRRYAISGDNSGTVLLWDIDNGSAALRLQAHHSPIVWCDISADCSRAVTLDSEGHAHLWGLDMQVSFDVLRQQSDQLCSLQYFSGGTQMVVGYSDGMVRCWQISGDTILMRWSHAKHESNPVEVVAVSSNSEYVATGSRNGRIVVVLGQTGAVHAILKGHTAAITALHFSADSHVLVSAARDGSVCVWPAEFAGSGVPLHNIQVPGKAEILAAAVSSAGKMAVAGCVDGMVYLYHLTSGRQLHCFRASGVPVRSVAFNDDGKLVAAGSFDGSAMVYDIPGGYIMGHFVGNASAINNVYFSGISRGTLTDVRLVTVCARQAITWDISKLCRVKTADFVADVQGVFHTSTMSNRTFINHHGMSLFDPLLDAAIYDMRAYEKHPGDSYLFKDGTSQIIGGIHSQGMVMYTPPGTTVHMLLNESGGARSLDFSADGHLLVAGNLRGELAVFDVEHHTLLYKWSAHKRTAITCVKFTHEGTAVYSCGEDCKVILWDWRKQTQLNTLSGHQAPVVSVDMSLDGSVMVSGDKDGIIIVWDTESMMPRQIIPAHEGQVLCCSVSPDGTKVATSGADEHIAILDVRTGQEVMVLDDALDGKGNTIKFSFDGTRIQIGGEKGSVLIWDIQRNCLLYDISAHDGKVFDCSWSGDSRRLLSVGSDGRARLWDAAAGSELCAANFQRGFGVVEAGGLIKCDLSVDGTTMAGCTAKGQLVLWYVGSELRRGPDGSMLYQWLASMPVSRGRELYTRLLEHFPLLFNTQDSRGWTILMHAAHDQNAEIVKLITGSVRAKSSLLGLMASLPANSPGTSSSPPVTVERSDTLSAAGDHLKPSRSQVSVSGPSHSRQSRPSGAGTNRGPGGAGAMSIKHNSIAPEPSQGAQAGWGSPPMQGGGGGAMGALGGLFKRVASIRLDGGTSSGGGAASPIAGAAGRRASTSDQLGPLPEKPRAPVVLAGLGDDRPSAIQRRLSNLGEKPMALSGGRGSVEGGARYSNASNARSSKAGHGGLTSAGPSGGSGGPKVKATNIIDLASLLKQGGVATAGAAAADASGGSNKDTGAAGRVGSSQQGLPNGDHTGSLTGGTGGSPSKADAPDSPFAEDYIGSKKKGLGSGWFSYLKQRMSMREVDHGEGSITNQQPQQTVDLEPNAIKIALAANSADCVSHILDAVLVEKITPGSYHAITAAIAEVAQKYPTMCEAFFSGLPLMVLGDMEIPSSIAAKGVTVEAANSYTSYKEMWQQSLKLSEEDMLGAMIVMEATMVRLPFAAAAGSGSILSTLVDSKVPVETFGASTVKSIIDYKWKRFARKQIYTKACVYLLYVVLFTVFAIVFSKDDPSDTFKDLLNKSEGRAEVVLSIILFLFGAYYMAMEGFQLYKLGASAYFDSFWNFIDLLSYGANLVIMPCVLFRYNIDQREFVPPMIAAEVILLWVKQMFFALAIDGLGTFIFMTIEIVKGMRYFILLLFMLFVSFGVSFMVLFRGPGLESRSCEAALESMPYPPPLAPYPPSLPPSAAPDSPLTPPPGGSGGGGLPPPYAPPPPVDSSICAVEYEGAGLLYTHFKNFQTALLSSFLVIFGNEDPRNALLTDWPPVAAVLLCLYNFTLIVVLLNMLITLMGEVYKKVVRKEGFVFLKGRAELVIEVESTMNQDDGQLQIPPYLHILRPVKKEARAEAMSEEEGNATVEEMLQALLAQKQGGGRGGGSEKGGGGDDGGDSDDGGDGGSAGNGTRGGGGSISLGGFGSTRSTYLDAFGSSRGRQTMTRMATMSRMATMNRMQSTRSMARQLSSVHGATSFGANSVDNEDTVLREVMAMKRMMETLMRRTTAIESVQRAMISSMGLSLPDIMEAAGAAHMRHPSSLMQQPSMNIALELGGGMFGGAQQQQQQGLQPPRTTSEDVGGEVSTAMAGMGPSTGAASTPGSARAGPTLRLPGHIQQQLRIDSSASRSPLLQQNFVSPTEGSGRSMAPEGAGARSTKFAIHAQFADEPVVSQPVSTSPAAAVQEAGAGATWAVPPASPGIEKVGPHPLSPQGMLLVSTPTHSSSGPLIGQGAPAIASALKGGRERQRSMAPPREGAASTSTAAAAAAVAGAGPQQSGLTSPPGGSGAVDLMLQQQGIDEGARVNTSTSGATTGIKSLGVGQSRLSPRSSPLLVAAAQRGPTSPTAGASGEGAGPSTSTGPVSPAIRGPLRAAAGSPTPAVQAVQSGSATRGGPASDGSSTSTQVPPEIAVAAAEAASAVAAAASFGEAATAVRQLRAKKSTTIKVSNLGASAMGVVVRPGESDGGASEEAAAGVSVELPEQLDA